MYKIGSKHSMQQLKVNKEFKQILNRIKEENKSITEWREIESSDMFQSESFNGGFDATEDKFLFSYYDLDGKEYWFEFSLEEVGELLIDPNKQLELRNSDR